MNEGLNHRKLRLKSEISKKSMATSPPAIKTKPDILVNKLTKRASQRRNFIPGTDNGRSKDKCVNLEVFESF